jgi:hypothetical protein
MDDGAITHRLSNLQEGLEKRMDFSERVSSPTATLMSEVNFITTAFKKMCAAVTESNVFLISHTGIHNRLEYLKVSHLLLSFNVIRSG